GVQRRKELFIGVCRLRPLRDPLPRGGRIGVALHYPNVGKLAQRLEARPPHFVLERGLGHDGHAFLEQEPQHSEEQRKCALREGIAPIGLEVAVRVHHAFLDLVAAYRRTPNRARELVRQRRLAHSSRTADDDECRSGHTTLSVNYEKYALSSNTSYALS